MTFKFQLFLLGILVLFGIILEIALSKVFAGGMSDRITVPYSVISPAYKSTIPRNRRRLYYIAASLRMYKESNSTYPQYGLIGDSDNLLSLPYWGDAKTRLFDSWGNRYLLGEFPVIVIADSKESVGDVGTYYYRVDTPANIDKATDYLNSITNLRMETEE